MTLFLRVLRGSFIPLRNSAYSAVQKQKAGTAIGLTATKHPVVKGG